MLSDMTGRLRAIKSAADAILAPICATNGRYLYDHADCPNMLENLRDDGVVISAKDFADLYNATDFEPDDIAQAIAALPELIEAWQEYFEATEELAILERARDTTSRFDRALARKEAAENMARAALTKAGNPQ